MTHTLYYKLLLGYLLFGFLGFVTIATFSSDMTYRHLLREEAEALYDEAVLIADNCSMAYEGKHVDLDSSYPQMDAVAVYLKADIWILDSRGRIIADTRRQRVGAVIEDFDPVTQGNRLYTLGRYFGQFKEDVLSVSAPITGNMNTYGYVVIHLPVSVVRAKQNDFLNIVYITSLILFGLSLIILLVFTTAVYLPLKKITYAANEYAAGNLSHHIEISSRDEIGYLAHTLNYMSDKLNEMEEYQKKLIANVSHDFRSPLTSIKGYLEAILDGTIPPELYQKYLGIIITETKRLTKLTQGMLTLDSLGSSGYLSRSKFDINRIIKDTAAAFEGACNAKGVTFDLTFSDTSQMVHADLGKIQQVLYNLIDNAIKFSLNDSVIYIQTSVRYEKVFVSIKDTGIGIPKDSINQIWERFYKTDLSRGKDKKGTGLGLSIVKEIIQSHGENIDVVSTEGVGTEFIFSLPKAGAA